jgi:hypothetical protein
MQTNARMPVVHGVPVSLSIGRARAPRMKDILRLPGLIDN